MATVPTQANSAPAMGRLETARTKFKVIEKIHNLYASEMLTDEDLSRIPSNIPLTDEEFIAYMQQLFQYGVKKWLPGCPVRIHNNVISVRLDGIELRRAKEVREILNKSNIRNYISEKNQTLYRSIEDHTVSRLATNSLIEFVEEEGREFYHIPVTSRQLGSNGVTHVYEGITLEGRSNQVLNTHYEELMTLIAQRNEERRREFVRNRTQLNAEYIKHVMSKLIIPFEHLRNPEMVESLQTAGLTSFLKKPTLDELVSNEIMVDVYSAHDEEDETWKIMPVTPEIVESTEERLYHGQGTITAIDPDSPASKDGMLPYVIQHCLRAAADINDFLAVLPEEVRENIEKANAIYERFAGASSETLSQQELADGHAIALEEGRRQEALVDILDAPSVSQLAQQVQQPVQSPEPQPQPAQDLDSLIREAFGKDVPIAEAVQEAQVSVVDSLTESILAQIAERDRQAQQPPISAADLGERRVVEAQDVSMDDIPFSQEPAVEPPTNDELYESLLQQLGGVVAQQARPQAEVAVEALIDTTYHPFYGQNAVFFNGLEYIAFNGIIVMESPDFSIAAVHAGKLEGQHIVYNWENRHREPTGDDVIQIKYL